MSNDWQYPIDREIKLFNRMDELRRLNEGLEEIGAEVGWPQRAVLDLSLACEELVVNIVNHGFPDGGEHRIFVAIQASPSSVEVKIEDGGIPFNPLDEADPLALLDMELEDRPIGGLGIFFVKRLMDDIHYEYAGGLNRFRMRKQFGAGKQGQQLAEGT
ncbi:ATP-binding protein [Paenibacillus arenilitoris]|uniref:ATP-binding protein n=1 Tax=Paenibacillus arenilitoris TaxID=2772299 RepID=A0A927CGD3_9BACL|nr:ATP-binding protein [Paenibacillus arenilitoris]MBD2867599.1 ATP-binding protein [Paenibacillus arenilitoris]